ncbi:3-keto-disaccharide hydrolase [Flagellimonas sp. S174]|uniref:3-keto-disaccharide hydrolase n=1 Tax=Flagellimonas sp. S174 TaxID=3410790 RepID=UPI003BF56F39
MARSILFGLSVFVFFLVSCKVDKKHEGQTWRTKKLAIENQVHNELLDVEKERGWRLLFDGESLNGWHLYNKPDSTQFSGWQVKDGALYCNATDETKVFGDLVTDKEYENYELVFDWQMALRGNGGVFINVKESLEYRATYQTGPEYQLLDPAHSDTNTPLKRPGCLWGISPQINNVEAKPTGTWNTAKIVQQNGNIEFYLNGRLTAKEDLTSSEWKNKVANSNFKDVASFGKTTRGKIALQNWYFDSWFRNIKIREL